MDITTDQPRGMRATYEREMREGPVGVRVLGIMVLSALAGVCGTLVCWSLYWV